MFDKKELDLFVPGRVCLFGEHSDWAGGYRRIDTDVSPGYAMIVGTNQGIFARVKKHPDKFIITSTLSNGKRVEPYEIPMDNGALYETALLGGFHSYTAGTACQINKRFKVGGLEINNYKTDLPIRKGLSSSAAICVLIARAFNLLYKLNMHTLGEMDFAYLGEITTPSRCGRMDQGCAFGQTPVFMSFDGDQMDVEALSPKNNIYMVLADLKAGKDTKKILADLNACFPASRDTVSENVRKALGPYNKEILLRAKKAMLEGDSKILGQLMKEAQALFDEFVAPACPEELTAPKLHTVLEYKPVQSLIWGCKGVGSQGDGSAQFIAKGPEEQLELIKILNKDLDVDCMELTIKKVGKDEQ